MEKSYKIELIVSRVSSGAQVLFCSEPASKWEQEALDTRNYLKCINIDSIPNDKLNTTFFDFICLGKNVAFICLNKYISGRESDLISAMIIVPGDVDIPGNKLVDLINSTKEELSATKRDDGKLKELYAHNYEKKEKPNLSLPSVQDGRYGYRYYGRGTSYSLSEIVGNLFQSYYSKFKAVFLIDKESDVATVDGVKNLTNSEFQESVILQYPSDAKRLGYELSINEEPFEEDYISEKGTTVMVTIKRHGFESVQFSLELRTTIALDLSEIEWEIKPLKSWFRIFESGDPNERELAGAIVYINEKVVDNRAKFKESDLMHAEINASCPDFDDRKLQDINIVQYVTTNRKVGIALRRQPKTLTYLITDVNGCNVEEEKIKFCFENTNHNPEESPLKYYEIIGESPKDTYYLKCRRFKKYEKVLIVVLFLFAAYGVYSGISNIVECFNQERSQVDTSEVDENGVSKVKKDVLADVIDYLDNHEKWERSEMEEYSLLKGLFDNIISDNGIDDKYQKVLESSEKLKLVKNKIQNSKKGILKNHLDSSRKVFLVGRFLSAEHTDSSLSEDGIKYLKENSEKWQRGEMEKCGLEELFDAVDSRKKDKVDDWNTIIKEAGIEAKYWDAIVKAVSASKKKGNRYTADNDYTITIQQYLKATLDDIYGHGASGHSASENGEQEQTNKDSQKIGSLNE